MHRLPVENPSENKSRNNLEALNGALPEPWEGEARTPEAEHKLTDERSRLPHKPGCYKYFDSMGRILYVGKAKDIKKRVASYFNKQNRDFKTTVLVSKIHHIEYVITNTEQEALLLENNLIKQYQPRYNLMLKDGKSYPYIVVKDERFPRVFSTRKKTEDGSTYYGPFPNYQTMLALLHFIRENYKLRTCGLNLSPQPIAAGKYRPCLEYHIKKCKAPCVAYQTEAEYNLDIQQIRHLLRGNVGMAVKALHEEMQEAAANLAFERAAELKCRLGQLKTYREKASVVSERLGDLEVATVATRDAMAVVNHFKLKDGGIVNTHAFVVDLKLQETPQEVLRAVVSHLCSEDADFARTLATNIPLDSEELAGMLDIEVPKAGDKRKLVELSLKNCFEVLAEKTNVSRLAGNRWDERAEKLLETMRKDLRLVHQPKHIECFDNSNIQGYEPVSSCVVFKNGKPSKKDYRHFRVRTVVGPDDFATMREVVFRRYRGVLERNEPLPDLIVIDGGKGQLSHAIDALKELQIEQSVPVIGIAKRLEEIYFLNDPVPLYIDKKSPTLKTLQNIRNEAHRFAVAYHRKRRDMATLKTELTAIPGIGDISAVELLKEFGSVERIKLAEQAELARVLGNKKAAQLARYFYEQESAGETQDLEA